MNRLVSKKSISEKKNLTLTLPPRVSGGKVHGNLDLVIEKIVWTTTKKYFNVEIIVTWWGQSEEEVTSIKFNLGTSSVLRYQVNTNYRLLQSYLRNCESITMQIFSVKNNNLIGCTRIPIKNQYPVKLFKVSSPILSPRAFKIGEMSVSIAINNDQTVSSVKENVKRVTFKEEAFMSNSNKENIEIIGIKKPILSHDARVKTKKEVFDVYRPMTAPPTSSNVWINSTCLQSINIELHDDVDCIKIAIIALDFNAAGMEVLKSFIANLKDKKCFLKGAVSSKIFKSSGDSKNLSNIFNSASQKIDFRRNEDLRYYFNKTARQSENIHLNIGFCLKSVEEEKPPVMIGITSINLNEILKRNLSLSKRCHVLAMGGSESIGVVTVDIGIGDIYSSQDKLERIENTNTFTSKKPLRVNQQIQTTCHPSKSSNDSENSSDQRASENKIAISNDGNSSSRNNHNPNNIDDHQSRDTEMIDVEIKENKVESKVYHALIFIESLRNVKEQERGIEYFFSYEGLWNQCEETSGVSKNFMFNYLKESPIVCDGDFLKRVQNNHLQLKLWEKTCDNSEKLVGSTLLSLHQFYIAFKDAIMIEHLSMNQLPIISTDAWHSITSPLFSELICQAKILLAIGSQQQIDHLKVSRNLHQESQPPQFSETKAQLKSRLSAFIESLSLKLPEAKEEACVYQQKVTTTSSPNIPQPQIRKTADLLDSLQEALKIKPIVETAANTIETLCAKGENMIAMLICIETATNLPKVLVKKGRKESKRKSKEISEYEPFVYVTFEASINDDNTKIVKSHEGNVYCTKVIKGCNPYWNESFEVEIPFDILRNPQKKFVAKVWRKAKFDNQQHFVPTPFDDAVLGFSAIDLSALLTGLPILSGYYNIVNFTGKTNGQIKLSFKPLQDVTTFRHPSSPLVTLARPLNINVNYTDPSTNDGELTLSRTLKRKFTELDEITLRLKARLFDVTGDENFDPDEEFEKDLNTVISDEDDNIENKDDFAWLMKDSTCSQLNKILKINQPSTSSDELNTRKISGCSRTSPDAPPPLVMDQLLKKYDLDELINPNIFKNILDPSSNSDSTPILTPCQNDAEMDDGESENNSATTASSIISNEQVQTIQHALQRASISEQKKLNSERKDPDGEHHVSE